MSSAAWLPAPRKKLAVSPAPVPVAGDGEIVVRNRAVALNPIDWIIQAAGDFVFAWIKYPFVLGSDLAGEVVEVGANVSRFKIGDRVLGHAVGTDPKRNSAAEGAFRTDTVLLAAMASPIPSDLSYERACVLPLGLSTAACGLFQQDFLALAHPSATPKPNGTALLVWGGSTSVGSNAIQLAVAAGYEVVTTASPANFDYVKRLGASRAFDYKDPNVVRDVIAALNGKTLAGAIAIGRGSPELCADVVHACPGKKFVAIATYPVTFGGTPGHPDPRFPALRAVPQFLWFTVTMAIKARRLGVRTKAIFGSSLAHNEVGRLIYEQFLPRALAEGRFVAAPEARVAGTGLESIQSGLDLLREGVSASKVVISLPAG